MANKTFTYYQNTMLVVLHTQEYEGQLCDYYYSQSLKNKPIWCTTSALQFPGGSCIPGRRWPGPAMLIPAPASLVPTPPLRSFLVAAWAEALFSTRTHSFCPWPGPSLLPFYHSKQAGSFRGSCAVRQYLPLAPTPLIGSGGKTERSAPCLRLHSL